MGLQEMPVRPASLFLLGSMHIFGLIKKRKHIIDNTFKYFFKNADTKSGWKLIDDIISPHSMKKTIPIGVSPSKDSNIQDSQSTPFSLDRSDGSLAKIYSDFKEKDLFLNNDLEVKMQFDIDNTGRELEVIQARRMWDVVLFAYETLYEVETHVKLIRDSIIPIFLSKKWINENNPQTKSPAQLKFFGGDDIWGNITNDWELGLWDNTQNDITGNFSNISKFLVLSTYEDYLHFPFGNRQMPSTICGGENEYGPIALKHVPWDSVKESLNDILNILISGDITSLWYSHYKPFRFYVGNIIQGNISTGDNINGVQTVENSDKFKYNIKVYNGINHIPRTWYRNIVSAFDADGFNVKLSNNEWNGSGFYYYYDKFTREEFFGPGGEEPGDYEPGDIEGIGTGGVEEIEENNCYPSVYELWGGITRYNPEVGYENDFDVTYNFKDIYNPRNDFFLNGVYSSVVNKNVGARFDPEDNSVYLGFNILYDVGNNPLRYERMNTTHDSSTFSFYIPPKVTYISCTIYAPRDLKQGLVCRFKQPPDALHINDNFDDISWVPWTQVNFPDDYYQDIYVSSLGGSAGVINDRSSVEGLSDSGCFYIKLSKNFILHGIQLNMKMDYDDYVEWYDSYNWNKDEHICGLVCKEESTESKRCYPSVYSAWGIVKEYDKEDENNYELAYNFKDAFNPRDDFFINGTNVVSPTSSDTFIGSRFYPATNSVYLGFDVLSPTIETQLPSRYKRMESDHDYDTFSFYIPPKVTYVYFVCYTPTSSTQGLVCRFKQPPDDALNIDDNFDDINWGYWTSERFPDYYYQDFYLRSRFGMIEVIKSHPGEDFSDGGCFYIKLPKNFILHGIHLDMRMDYDDYVEWYDSSPWLENEDICEVECKEIEPIPVDEPIIDPVLPPYIIDEDVSLDDIPQPVKYISNEPCKPGDPNCKPNINTITPEKTYIHTVIMPTFKDKFNPNDPKIITKDVIEENEFILETNILNTPEIVKIPPRSYFFIPPGAKSISAVISVPEESKQGVVVRYNKLPDYNDDEIWNKNYYNNINWVVCHKSDLISLTNADSFIANYKGKIKIFSDLKFDPPLSKDESGWVHIHQLPFNDNTIFNIKITIQVDYTKYRDWYNPNFKVTSDYMSYYNPNYNLS